MNTQREQLIAEIDQQMEKLKRMFTNNNPAKASPSRIGANFAGARQLISAGKFGLRTDSVVLMRNAL